MPNTDFSVEAYLRRIQYHGPRKPTLRVLQNLHRQHLLTVPFENLDIHLGKKIVLDPSSFYRKIVEDRRGGYCYELNGCFSLLLQRLGFKVSMLSARVAGKYRIFSPEYDHMTLLVRLAKRWLADVGFGDSFTSPLAIDKTEPEMDRYYQYRVTGSEKRRLVSRKPLYSKGWLPLYSFSLSPRKLAEFRSRNTFQQESPHSHFTKGPMISLLTKSGRITLTDKKLLLTRGTKRIESPIRNRSEFVKLLGEHFRIKIRSSEFPDSQGKDA